VGPYSVATYSASRRADPRIAAHVRAALGDARSVVNVGAGAGSYEPEDLEVIAVEPSPGMIAQRSSPAIEGLAEALPLADDCADAAMAVLTVHHWSDLAAGLREMRRVARRRVVVLHFDVAVAARFWLVEEYLPEIAEQERDFPTPADIVALLDAPAEVLPVPVPHDCTDGFLGAYWRRPAAYLDPVARAAISSFTALGDGAVPGLERLRADLESGAWEERHADLLDREALDIGYRLVVASLA
jgi:SAM-dependent methyltransferase